MKKVLILIMGLFFSFVSLIADEPTGDISAYFEGKYIDSKKSISKLEAAGFEVLADYKSIKKGKTIIFTCPTLKAEAAKEGRAYVGVMRMFIDEQEKSISITNPVYFGRAYMQDDYEHTRFSAVAAKIKAVFPDLKNSSDKMSYDELAAFNFTIGMPYYEDQEIIAEGPNSELIAKAKAFNKGKKLVFELKLSNKSTLLGYKLSNDTARFPKKIGRRNSALLPWSISIEDKKAKILQGEYYIVLNYPSLDLDEYKEIRSIPRSVIKDLSRPFKE